MCLKAFILIMFRQGVYLAEHTLQAASVKFVPLQGTNYARSRLQNLSENPFGVFRQSSAADFRLRIFCALVLRKGLCYNSGRNNSLAHFGTGGESPPGGGFSPHSLRSDEVLAVFPHTFRVLQDTAASSPYQKVLFPIQAEGRKAK